MRKKGYRTLLRALYNSQLSESCILGLFYGFLDSFAASYYEQTDAALDHIILISTQDQMALSALRKLVMPIKFQIVYYYFSCF